MNAFCKLLIFDINPKKPSKYIRSKNHCLKGVNPPMARSFGGISIYNSLDLGINILQKVK